jgi:transcriptional regulator with GAF, ATPase, and Fis domain
MLHLVVDKDHQYKYIPWLATYLAKNGTVTVCPPVDRGEGVVTSFTLRPDGEFSSCISPRGEELLSSCFAAMIHCLGVRRCYVMLLDKERWELVVVKASSKGTPSPGDRIALSQSIVGWVVEHKQSLVSANHIMEGLRVAKWEKEYANGPFLAVPIQGEEELHGVLMACNKLNGGIFSEHDLVTAEMLANHLALCIEGGFLFQKDAEKLNSVSLHSMGKPS